MRSSTPGNQGEDVVVLDGADTACLAPMRLWVRNALGRRLHAAELVLTELLANAIEHGAPGAIRVGLAQSDDAITISVRNPVRGRGPRPTNSVDAGGETGDTDRAAAPRPPLGERPEARGRGLVIVDALTDDVTVDFLGHERVTTVQLSARQYLSP